ncbi:MAG: peptidoglycan editing factor PgeF [Acidovorax sp.]|uniref:peptidoglycan editing factor PgeF n=1 Tax=Acidovorax sp. TaxID=1872122 RepID=UPI00262DED25|nr:peptidoglycan editing factor PgeF [Acidovorax sp.]MDH4463536.1 peptidoglycan editing factor PgeF [Acidovorax sp.]
MLKPDLDWLVPEGLPANVGGLMATRAGGYSVGSFAGLNLRPVELPPMPGQDADDATALQRNGERFTASLEGATPVWLNQVHGTQVQLLDGLLPGAGAASGRAGELPVADASITTQRGVACTVLVADCLPVLFATADGAGVGAAHAGWRGLAHGVLEATLARLCEATGQAPAQVHAWLGACIGPTQFEVGEDVRAAFGPACEAFFKPGQVPGKWMADLPGLARWRLQQAGVVLISGGQWCTVSAPERFFSYRRDRQTGRHAAAIWRR